MAEITSGRRKQSPFQALLGYLDLLVVGALAAALLGIALAFGDRGGPSLVRVPLGFLFVFVLPGYALTSALFPGATVGPSRSVSLSLGPVERVVLSVGLSLVTVPLVSILLTLLSVPITFRSVLFSLGGFILVCLLVAGFRTYRTPPRDRFAPLPGSLGSLDGQALAPNRVNVVFAVALVLAGAGLGVALVGSGPADSYSELTLQAVDEDGNTTAAAYPETLTVEESAPLHVEIENHEHRPVSYTVVVLLEEVESDEVVDRTELDRFEVELDHAERAQREHDLVPTRTGDSLRVSYLLYVDETPDQPTVSNADRSVHFFTEVDEAS